jgi:hypothetical protein
MAHFNVWITAEPDANGRHFICVSPETDKGDDQMRDITNRLEELGIDHGRITFDDPYKRTFWFPLDLSGLEVGYVRRR